MCCFVPGSWAQAAQSKCSSAVALQKPPGPSKVGTVIYRLTDRRREDIVSPTAGDHRRLVVQIWYPAEPRGESTAPYMPEIDVLRMAFGKAAEQLECFQTNSFLNAALERKKNKFPVLIFSHGMGTPRSFYTSLFEELASNGYVVAAIDHPYMGIVAVDGEVVKAHPGWTQPPPGGLADKTDEERDKYWSTSNDQLAADQSFVLDELERYDRGVGVRHFKNRLALDRVAIAGHSQGFVSKTCAVDKRFKACINLDGVPALAERRNGLHQPFMTIRDGDDSPRATAIFSVTKNIAYDVLVPDMGHNSYLDKPLAAAYKYKVDAVRSHAIIVAYVTAFLDTYLNGKTSALLQDKPREYPEVVFTSYRTAKSD